MKTYHLVKPGELNHENTLFGGYAMAAADAAAYICAALAYPTASFVTRNFEGFDFHHPARAGDILELTTELCEKRNTSVSVTVAAVNARTRETVFSTKGVFVNVKEGQKAPLPAPAPDQPTITVEYTNWRGETRQRDIIPLELEFGATEWHPQAQWLLKAKDAEDHSIKAFALKDANFKV